MESERTAELRRRAKQAQADADLAFRVIMPMVALCLLLFMAGVVWMIVAPLS